MAAVSLLVTIFVGLFSIPLEYSAIAPVGSASHELVDVHGFPAFFYVADAGDFSPHPGVLIGHFALDWAFWFGVLIAVGITFIAVGAIIRLIHFLPHKMRKRRHSH